MHPEEELVRVLRKMLPEGACENVLPPLLALCRGDTGPVVDRHFPAALEHQHFHHPDRDPPYYWDMYYADD